MLGFTWVLRRPIETVTQSRRSELARFGGYMKSLSSFSVRITRLFGYVSATIVVWLGCEWIYNFFDESVMPFPIELVPILLFAVLCLSVTDGNRAKLVTDDGKMTRHRLRRNDRCEFAVIGTFRTGYRFADYVAARPDRVGCDSAWERALCRMYVTNIPPIMHDEPSAI
jgi:hypothetical protein